jgi:ADP-ribose pyrophosphatase
MPLKSGSPVIPPKSAGSTAQMEQNPWTIQTKNTVYENSWIKVDHHQVMDPNGKAGIYGTVHYKHTAIGVVPLNESLETWLVGQYRFPLNLYSWEIPEGGAHADESPLDAAKRELKEETGLSAGRFEPLLEMHLSNSTSDEKAIVFMAFDLTLGPNKPDSTELLHIKKLSFSSALQMVLDGQITDAISVAAILKTAHVLKMDHRGK